MSERTDNLWRQTINYDGVNGLVIAPVNGRCRICSVIVSNGIILCNKCCEEKKNSSNCRVHGCKQRGSIIESVGYVYDFCGRHSEEGTANLIRLLQHRQNQIIHLQEGRESEAIRNKDRKRPRDVNSEETLELTKKAAVQAFQLEALENDRQKLIQEVVNLRTLLTLSSCLPQTQVVETQAVTKPTSNSNIPIPNFLQ